MEIERKFTVKSIPANLSEYPCRKLEQGYLNTSPVVRVRREDDNYYLTYKGKGFLVREEHNLALTKEAYLHLREKADGLIITKDRYLIPFNEKLTIELDIFAGPLAPLVLAEVEFETEEEANTFTPPEWFDKDVTNDPSFSNSALSQMF
ncbi:MAG: CYTH domain-containing protein [Lachnospiraceae bacterium]|nr:CYTH domain-containing protein [Lachnospiraceae bacterium]